MAIEIETSRIYEVGGHSMRIEVARRADGQWFRRLQDHHPRFGYRWTRWTAVTEPDMDRLMTTYMPRTARLPREG